MKQSRLMSLVEPVGSLSNLANRLSGLGRGEEALAAGQEAVELYRALAAARPKTFSVDLSISLGMFTDDDRDGRQAPGARDHV